MKSEKFLESYLNATAACGEEYSSENEQYGQNVWVDYVKEFTDEISVDPFGTALAVVKSEAENPLRVIIEAHADEICWMVQHIEADGRIRVKRNGGSDNIIAPSLPVVIRTFDGKYVKGVFGSPAIHTWTADQKHQKVEELFIDLGYTSKKEVLKKGIEVGNMVIYDVKYQQLGKFHCGKALDDKIGGYIIAEVAKRLRKNNVKLPFDLYIANTVQEETGLLGSTLIAKQLNNKGLLPHLSLNIDVCHDTNILSAAKHGETKGGDGPVIEHTSHNNRKLIKKVKEVAKNKKIKLQASTGSQGNNSFSFFLEAVPSLTVSMAMRYMHTSVELVHTQDVKDLIDLYYETLISIDTDFINSVHNV